MKKLILLISLIVFITAPAFAVCDYSSYCPAQPYDISSKCGQAISKYTGMNFISERIVEAILGRKLKKATKENFKVEIKSYSPNDLFHGRFKSLKISGKNLDIDDVYITAFDVKTLCDFNYVDLSNKTVKFKENMALEFSMTLSDSDLRKTVQTSGYLDMLNKVNLSGFGITFFKLNGADVQIKNNKLYFTIKVTTPMSAKPFVIVLKSDLKVEDGQIVLTKVELANLYTVLDLSKATSLLNFINPLTFSTEILNNKHSKMSVQSVDIIGDKIYVKGNILIPKNTK